MQQVTFNIGDYVQVDLKTSPRRGQKAVIKERYRPDYFRDNDPAWTVVFDNGSSDCFYQRTLIPLTKEYDPEQQPYDDGDI